MSDFTAEQIQNVLQTFKDPYLNKDYWALDAVTDLQIDGLKVSLSLCLGYPADKERLTAALEDLLSEFKGLKLSLALELKTPSHASAKVVENIAGVRNIIAVSSGKGGVGKSTTAVNVALALQALGATVGVLDADIYGPSMGLMLGVTEGVRPEVKEQKHFLPIKAHGLSVMSMSFLISELTPVVWRGPKATGALMQLLNQTQWGELDYLIVDMPPGTGDIHLTLSQQVAVAGAIVVTTPQDIALLDAKKGIEMFRKVNIPVLGVVENMATHHCSQCGHEEHIFGEGGAQRIAEQYETALLGALPLTLTIRQHADSGTPTVAALPDSPEALIYRSIAQAAAAQLWQQSMEKEASDDLSFVEIRS